MQRCIYCPTSFDEAPKEHVIHAFLGARWKDGRLICQTCQKEYSDGIDAAIANRLQPFRLLLGTEGDHGGTGKPLENLQVSSGETIDLGPHGQPTLRRPSIKITPKQDSHVVEVKVGTMKQLGWAAHEIQELLPSAQLDPEQMKSWSVKKSERLEGEVTIDLTLGGIDFFRGMLKCCANLFAAHDNAARDAFLEPAFDSVREFVRTGAGQMSDFVRWITADSPLQLPKNGPADHCILITSRGESMEGVIQFFGHLPFAVRLTTAYQGPPIRCAYVVDPYRESDPAERRLAGDEVASFEQHVPNFVEQSAENDVAVQAAWRAALNRFMDHYTQRENELTLQKAADEARKIDPRIAAMPISEVIEKMRELMNKRKERFERTGDATGITFTNIGGVDGAGQS